MISIPNRLIILCLIILTIIPCSLYAQWDQQELHVDARLVSEVNTIQPGASFWVTIRLQMNDGWHTYWRNPGDAGLETTIKWQLPEGFNVGELNWPYPYRISEPPLMAYGYHDTIYLLTEFKVDQSVKTDQVVFLKAYVSWLECADVCIPGNANLKVRLEVKDAPMEINEHYIETFAKARAHLPITSEGWNLQAAVDGNRLTIQAAAPEWLKHNLGEINFYPYKASFINNVAEQKVTKQDNQFQMNIELAKMDPQIPDTVKGVLVSENGWRGPDSERAMEVIIPLSEDIRAVSTSSSELSNIWLALLFSFIGGIILNLMPCVLPVLSIKIMGLVNQAHEKHSKSWQHGGIFTLGVLVSFWILAGIILILKAGGTQLGWGFQLQSPVFLIILSAFMFLFGLSMFGVFEIGTSLTTIGGKTQGRSGLGGSFLSGVTATIVATPCTAPFMGPALGFALTQPAYVSLLIFTFIGLGMSAPYVLLTSIPALLKFVPKPGRWMESMKQFMGFLLVATVIWLLWVLGLQAGSNVVALVLFVLLVTSIGAWIYGRWGHLAMPKKTRVVSTLIAVILIISANAYAVVNVDTYAVSMTTQTATAGEGIEWKPYSDEAVEQAKKSGNPVFIDFTAAWCLSCQVNEQIAFSSEEVQNRFRELNIQSFKADWTSHDEKITRALAKYGRNSVPLYVLHSGNHNDEPKILPEIITPGIILKALKSLE